METFCPTCGGAAFLPHDHKADNSGLDDGPQLRKKPRVKSAEELREVRTRAWATRRAKYGQKGHR